MVSLIDLVPLTEKVMVRGLEIEVCGISAEGLAHLLASFPELRMLLTERKFDITVELIMERMPQAIAAIIATGTGNMGNKKIEEVARRLSIAEQVDLLSAIAKATFPRGTGPFVEALSPLLANAGVEFGKEADTKSPEPFNSALAPDTLQRSHGDTPRAN